MESVLKLFGIECDSMTEVEDPLGLCEWSQHESPKQNTLLDVGHLLYPGLHLV